MKSDIRLVTLVNSARNNSNCDLSICIVNVTQTYKIRLFLPSRNRFKLLWDWKLSTMVRKLDFVNLSELEFHTLNFRSSRILQIFVLNGVLDGC